MTQRPLLWTTVHHADDGVALAVRGALTPSTEPALDALLCALLASGERLRSIDLRATRLEQEASARLLQRWGAVPGTAPHLYDLQPPDLSAWHEPEHV